MPEARSRSRSRSPYKSSHHRSSHRHRSPSPNEQRPRSKHHHHHHHAAHSRSSTHASKLAARPLSTLDNPYARPVVLPYKAVNLAKRDLHDYTPMFASYLDIQKQIALEELDDEEVKGRWKRFCGKWNRGELAEGWYDPETKRKADAYAAEAPTPPPQQKQPRASPTYAADADANDDAHSSDYGPSPPRRAPTLSHATNPSFADLALRDEALLSSAALARTTLRHARASDLTTQRALLDELAPRADAGTRERRLENKRDARALRQGAADDKEVPEAELLGPDEDDGNGARRMRKEEERRKSEREVRREEGIRARQAEREEKLAALRGKEERTMDMLRAIARERFG